MGDDDSRRINERDAEAVEKGMTKKQVRRLLGPPAETRYGSEKYDKIAGGHGTHPDCWRYDSAGPAAGLAICFDQRGRVFVTHGVRGV